MALSRGRAIAGLLSVALLLAAGAAAWVGVGHLGSGQSGAGHSPSSQSGARTSGGAPNSATPTPSALWQLPIRPASAVLSPQPSAPARGKPPVAAAVRSTLAPLLADPALAGTHVSMVVTDPTSGTGELFDQDAAQDVPPASTAKLAVAVAALQALGEQQRFSTTVLLDERGQVVLVGGGDPTLAGPAAVGRYAPGFPQPARLSDLASATATALKARGLTSIQLRYDDHLFTGPDLAPGWKPIYVAEGDVAPVTALEVDEGVVDFDKPARSNDPARAAAEQFATALRADGIAIAAAPDGSPDGVAKTVLAHGDGEQLAAVQSPTVAELVQRMLGRSDNDLAEALARHVALAERQPASFSGAVAAVRHVVSTLGVDPAGLSMADASGLSTSDRVHPRALVQLVRIALNGRRFVAVLKGLPVAAFSGTLTDRFTAAPANAAAGDVHAKTGTLATVVSLAGYVIDDSGRTLAFAVVVTGVPPNAPYRVEAAVDRLTAGLASCGCQ